VEKLAMPGKSMAKEFRGLAAKDRFLLIQGFNSIQQCAHQLGRVCCGFSINYKLVDVAYRAGLIEVDCVLSMSQNAIKHF